jgi:metal-responsive CopG/Arc/MetJ family transcriptional regulator
MNKLEVEMEHEVVDALEEVAEEEGKTRSRVASEMVSEWLRRRSA